jgi:hypothetical protein
MRIRRLRSCPAGNVKLVIALRQYAEALSSIVVERIDRPKPAAGVPRD